MSELSELDTKLKTLRQIDQEFFTEAFTNPVTREPYNIPEPLRIAATRICQSYGIRGTCDPMYIANVIAVELGLGDGFSNFKEGR